MTSSRDDLPPGLQSMWRLVKLGYSAEPRLLVFAFAMVVFAALPDALLALWLALLARGVEDSDRTVLMIAAAGIGLSAVATWFLRVVGDRTQRRFRDRVTIFLESHVARLQASVSTIEHHERPDYLDRLSVLRNQVFTLDHMYMSVFSTAGWILRLAVTVILLMSVSPWLVLLVAFALPTVLTASWRPGIERAAEEGVASRDRLARHLFVLGTTAPPGKEVRLTGIGPNLVEQRQAAWGDWYEPVARARWSSAFWHSIAWAIFGIAYVGAVVFVTSVLDASVAAVLLVLAAGSRLSQYVGATVGEIGFLRGIWLDGARRLAWLEDYAQALDEHADQPVPDRLEDGIRLEHVSFRYPGTDRVVLDDVSLDLPAGTVVAIVGENGAGKSTLVKLLCRFYQPDAGNDHRRRHRSRAHAGGGVARPAGRCLPGLLPLRARRGAHRRPRRSRAARRPARDRYRGRRAPARATSSIASRAGSTRSSVSRGTKVSTCRSVSGRSSRSHVGSCATYRCCSCSTSRRPRSTPRPSTPCSSGTPPRPAAPTGVDSGRITVLVSHRFSTVRMADLIVVLDGARVVEVGTHEALIAQGGQYAELYGIQAAAYR